MGIIRKGLLFRVQSDFDTLKKIFTESELEIPRNKEIEDMEYKGMFGGRRDREYYIISGKEFFRVGKDEFFDVVEIIGDSLTLFEEGLPVEFETSEKKQGRFRWAKNIRKEAKR